MKESDSETGTLTSNRPVVSAVHQIHPAQPDTTAIRYSLFAIRYFRIPLSTSVLARSDLNQAKVRFWLYKAEDEGGLAPVEDDNAVQAKCGEGLV